ncbi:hypothetical protein BCR44DRAFT_1432808 [Catenaria anguillulae PL171]|uniref:Uncharacterized protein n=1 Tax=Catenaria anguillulae PL171 TaxID=765915 RepID=A0A1Y2HQM9_9FUNG|nr:hypothetical protein BCR44DRAFT_1432808 [Catenaria anguillulae PL171]
MDGPLAFFPMGANAQAADPLFRELWEHAQKPAVTIVRSHVPDGVRRVRAVWFDHEYPDHAGPLCAHRTWDQALRLTNNRQWLVQHCSGFALVGGHVIVSLLK